jgi:hypothetical protein
MKLAANTEQGIGFSIAQEDVHCLSCESVIPSECVQMKIDERAGVQTVKAYCEHCDKLYQINRTLRGGNWMSNGTPEVVTDRNVKASFTTRIDKLRGNVQQSSCA